ncbi:MAG: hypothetical protein JO328_10890 [Hyphomicrobiales bacterium]|nr:hypothetical protein [Hyphomicrobiales bacterium]MBV8827154.1 hypothetical protein [Hyphomicrobiales bacterium]MBV9427948.1 hypothetical protein [Bradyrhizobiaceae bacterium]
MSTMIAWVIVICGASVLVGACHLHLRTLRILKFEKSADEFYNNLDVLIRDEDAPERALELFVFLNNRITDRRLPRLLLVALLLRRNPPHQKIEDDVLRYYGETRKELREPFFMALMWAIFAMTYNSPLAGWLARRLVLFDLERHKDRAPDIISVTYKAGDGLAHAH